MSSLRKIVKKLIPTRVFRAIEPFGHLVETIIFSARYGFPARGMHVIGVTGTNGKTTTSMMIQRMLHEAGYKTALLSTVMYGVGDELKNQIEHMTTVSAPVLQKRLRDFKRAGVEWVVVETSSHALAQYRTWGLPYEIAVMTNITHEHLDYHGTFENYREAKRRLFKWTARRGRKLSIVNAEDPAAALFASTTPRSVTYGLEHGDIQARDIKLSVVDCRFTAVVEQAAYNTTVNIPGKFNILNALATIAVGRELGLTKGQIEQGIAALRGVEGRMTRVDEGQPFSVIVDFAGTPDAFEHAFGTLRPATKGKLVTVFGSPAHRDTAKRPVQGEIAGRYSDVVVVTEEDDRDEDGQKIMEEIAAGAIKAGKTVGKDLFLIGHRDEAITFALQQVATADDTVTILGKGHEKTLERGDQVLEWSDIEVTKKALRELRSTQNH